MEAPDRMEQAAKYGDWGSFYRALRSLPDNAQAYTPEQARAHMLSIGGEANNVDIDAVIHRMPPVANWNLDNPKEWDEFVSCLRGMKESAAGQDECTITMIRSAHELVQQAILEVTT